MSVLNKTIEYGIKKPCTYRVAFSLKKVNGEDKKRLSFFMVVAGQYLYRIRMFKYGITYLYGYFRNLNAVSLYYEC